MARLSRVEDRGFGRIDELMEPFGLHHTRIMSHWKSFAQSHSRMTSLSFQSFGPWKYVEERISVRQRSAPFHGWSYVPDNDHAFITADEATVTIADVFIMTSPKEWLTDSTLRSNRNSQKRNLRMQIQERAEIQKRTQLRRRAQIQRRA